MIILDVQASNHTLDSYPIEIAWQHFFEPTMFDSFYIRPSSAWTNWDRHAQHHKHHIKRESLLAAGIDALEATIRLNIALRDQYVYADTFDYVSSWMERLFRTAGMSMDFRLMNIQLLLNPKEVESYKRKLSEAAVRNSALADARQIVSVLRCFSG